MFRCSSFIFLSESFQNGRGLFCLLVMSSSCQLLQFLKHKKLQDLLSLLSIQSSKGCYNYKVPNIKPTAAQHNIFVNICQQLIIINFMVLSQICDFLLTLFCYSHLFHRNPSHLRSNQLGLEQFCMILRFNLIICAEKAIQLTTSRKLQYIKMCEIISLSRLINNFHHKSQQLLNNFIYQMSRAQGLSVHQIYTLVNHTDVKGVEGYHVEKKYFDAAKQMKEKELSNVKKGQKDRKHVTKRGNYLQDQQKVHKAVPGPGQYPLNLEWPQKSKLKINYPDKQTYVDEIMKQQKRQKKPAPGQYQVTKSLKDLQAQKKRLAEKKVKVQDRLTYLDEIQYQANTLPGVGSYIVRQRVKTEFSHLKSKPDDWRKKHDEKNKKKPQKSPDMRTYKPKPADYTLFQNISKDKSSKKFLGKVQRFKTAPSGSGLNPDKYNVIQEWKGKDKAKVNRHGYEVLSTKRTNKSVYYH